MRKDGCLFHFLCLLMSLAVILSVRVAMVRYTTPPAPFTISEASEAYKPRKRKGN